MWKEQPIRERLASRDQKFFRANLKRPSHGKFKLANSCWQTQVGVCERHKNRRIETCLPTVFMPFTHTNLSLPTLVCRVKAALPLLACRTGGIFLRILGESEASVRRARSASCVRGEER